MFSRRAVILIGFSASLLLASAACAPGASPTATPSPSSTHSATAHPTPSSTPETSFITIDSPLDGATVPVPVSLSGTADTFEGALTVDALDAAGGILCVRSITASSGTGTPGSWMTTLAFPPQNTAASVTLRGYEISAKDGSMVNLVERQVTVSAERPPIFITAPACGDTVAPGGTLAVTGRATVFEAALTLELRDASGAVKASQNVLADVGGQESDFSAALAIPAGLSGGTYNLVAFNTSAKDGSIQNEFSVQVHVRAGQG